MSKKVMPDRPQIRVNIGEQRVWHDGQPVKVKNKVFSLLTLFLANPGRLLTKSAILRHVWPNTHVSDASVKDCVKNLRTILQDNAATPTFIETVRGRGYRYLGGIEVHGDHVAFEKTYGPSADADPDASGQSSDLKTAPSVDAGASPVDIGRFKRLSIIVMPFKELTDGGNAWLAEGLRLSLHSVLIKLPGFFVLNTGVVEGYRGQHYSAVNVGREIDVRYVVDGAVQCVGDRVRAIVELTDTEAQQIIWGETYDHVLDDIFDFQDEVAQEIVKALDIKLRAGDVGRLRFETTSHPSAREYLLRAISHLYRGDRDNTLLARQMLEKADQIEPDLAPCLGMIAITYWRESKFGWSDDPHGSLDSAADFAQRTLDLGDPEGVGHSIMGYVQLQKRLFDEATALSLEAFSRRPSCPLANALLAEVMRYCGFPDQSVTRIKEAMELARTFPPWMIDNLAASLRDNDEIQASISTAEEAVHLFPDDLDLLITLCSDYGYASMPREAGALAQRILAANPNFSIARYSEGQPYKDQAVRDRIMESLSRAGLPE